MLAVKLVRVGGLAAVLAGCTQTGGSSGPPSPGPAPTVASVGGCSGEIGRFRGVIDSDNATANVNGSVYKRIVLEVDRAASACAAGRDAEALSALSSTKRRYGYP
jgi:hypothetical protein